MRRTKEEAEITKQNLLKAALEVFSRKGYAATRVEDIAKPAPSVKKFPPSSFNL